MPPTTDDLLDAEWFFSGAAEAACGIRSSQGGIEAALTAKALCGKGADGCIQLHETRNGRDFDPVDRLGAYSRAREIHNRVRKLSQHDHLTLALQFGDGAKMGRVSMSLIASQPSAIKGHAAAVAAAAKVLASRKPDTALSKLRATKKQNKARERAKTRSPGMTIADFLRWLACHDDATREMLRLIVAEAEKNLDAALEAFAATEQRAA